MTNIDIYRDLDSYMDKYGGVIGDEDRHCVVSGLYVLRDKEVKFDRLIIVGRYNKRPIRLEMRKSITFMSYRMLNTAMNSNWKKVDKISFKGNVLRLFYGNSLFKKSVEKYTRTHSFELDNALFFYDNFYDNLNVVGYRL